MSESTGVCFEYRPFAGRQPAQSARFDARVEAGDGETRAKLLPETLQRGLAVCHTATWMCPQVRQLANFGNGLVVRSLE